jgi:hypothetical protein
MLGYPLVAKTSFGFWVAFFYAEYSRPGHNKLWSGHSLKRVFPHASSTERIPKEIKKTLERGRCQLQFTINDD